MAESYSVKAILSAVDSGFSSTINKAISSISGVTKKTGTFGDQANGSFRKAADSASNFTSSVAKISTAIGITQAVTAGINAMRNSMSGAVSRMDTLNNSSRVFKNMGFAAGDTSKMMDKLQESIKGLPTPLDEAVKGVQMIASTTGDIGRAQAVWSALNDAILGFGGSTADVNNAVLQLSQAFSNGKIDGMTWISMMNSQMGPVLTAIAKKMGITTGQLKDGLSSGKISVQQFQDALIELDKNGGGGLASLHQIALTATGGISTSMQNAKTSITRGLTEMLKGFDTFAQSVTGLNLSQIITQIGYSVEGVLDKVAATIPKAATHFKNLGLTADQSKGLITGFVTAAMAIGGIVAVAPAIAAVVTAFGGLSGAIAQLRGVFAGLVTFMVSPWGLVVAAIGLVVAALGELYAKFQPFHDAVNNVVSSFVKGFGQAIPQALNLLNGLFNNLLSNVQLIASAIQNQLGGAFAAITPQVVSQGIVGGLTIVIQFIQNVIGAVAQMTAAFINTGAIQTIWQAIESVMDAVRAVILAVVDAVQNYIANAQAANGTTSIWTSIGTAIGNIAKWIANATASVANFVTQSSYGLNQVFSAIMQVIGGIVQMVQAFLNTQAIPEVWQALVAIMRAVYTSIETIVDAIKNYITNSQAISGTTSVWDSMGTAIGNVVVWLAQAVQGVANFVTQSTGGLEQVVTVILQVITSVIQMVQAFLNTGAVSVVWQAIIAVIQALGAVISAVISIISQFVGTNATVNGSESPWQILGTAIGKVAIFLADVIIKIANFITSVSNAIQQLSPFEQRLIGIGLAAGALGAKFLLSSGLASNLAGSLLGLGGNSDKAKGSLDGVSSSSTNLGVQIGAAAAGIGIAAAGIAYLAQQGDAGTTALVGMTAAVVIVIATLAKFAPALQQNAAGITAFGTAMLGLGTGIAIASAGLTLLAQQGDAGTAALISMTAAIVILIAAFAKFSPVLQQNAAGITAFGTAMVGVGAGIALASAGMTMLATTGNAGLKVIVTLTISVAALAGVFALLGPSLTSSSAGIVAFGASIAAIGVGIGAASLGTAALVAAFTGLIAVMTNLNISSGQLVQNALALGSAFGVMVVTSIASVAIGLQQLAPLFMQTILTIGLVIADGAPQLAQEFLYLIIGIVQVIAQNLPQLLQAGTQLVVNFILGITSSLGQVIPAALQMITTFINAVAQNIQPVIAAGLNLLVQFLYGLALGLPQVIGAVAEVIATFLTSLAGHIQEIIGAGVDLLVNFLKGISNNLGKVISAVVDVIVSFVKAVADNIQKIIDAGIYLIEKLALGIVRALPKITDMGLRVVTEFVYAVGYALGKVTTSGGKLIVAFAKGVWDGVSGSRKAGDANINAIINAIQNTHLFKHGQELINGFLNGMKSAFEGVKQWVGGIGKWIEKHKGPIQYDRKLLIPAGKAIMNGFNSGLVDSFNDVQNNVSSMASSIAQAANSSFSRSINSLNAGLTNGTLTHAISGSLEVTKQPMSLNLVMGNNTYGAFVDDITKQQDISLSLNRF